MSIHSRIEFLAKLILSAAPSDDDESSDGPMPTSTGVPSGKDPSLLYSKHGYKAYEYFSLDAIAKDIREKYKKYEKSWFKALPLKGYVKQHRLIVLLSPLGFKRLAIYYKPNASSPLILRGLYSSAYSWQEHGHTLPADDFAYSILSTLGLPVREEDYASDKDVLKYVNTEEGKRVLSVDRTLGFWLVDRNSSGPEWLRSDAGIRWLGTPNGYFWLSHGYGSPIFQQSDDFIKFLNSPQGEAFLASDDPNGGVAWLSSFIGRKWLNSSHGIKWKKMKD